MIIMGDRERFITAIREIIGFPYIWGGTGKAGFDCSETILYGLRKTEQYYNISDMTSHKLGHDFFIEKWIDEIDIKKGCLIFYGDKLNKITHVMAVLKLWKKGKYILAGARGGNNKTTSIDAAYTDKAFVDVVLGDYWKSNQQFIVDPFTLSKQFK